MLTFLVDKIPIRLTPLNPQLLNFLTILLLISPIAAWPQIKPSSHLLRDSLTRFQTTYQALLIKNEYQARIEMQQFAELKKFDWMSYVPTVGYSAFFGINVGYDLTNISRFFREKQTKKSKRQEILEKYKLKAYQEYEIYLHLNQQYSSLQSEIELQKEIIALQARLFEISRQKYIHHEITPTEYLSKEITYRSSLLKFKKLEMQLNNLTRQIEIVEQLKEHYIDVY